MNTSSYQILSEDQLQKVGNTIIYLCDRIKDLSKTKLLKLLYILDEISIKKHGIPFLNLKYKLWKYGPVSEEFFIDLSDEPILLKDFVMFDNQYEFKIIKPNQSFNNDEFSKNDLQILDYVISKFGDASAKNLNNYTHRENSPWHLTALKNNVLELLESEKINSTNIFIDMSLLIIHDEKKLEIYNDFLESH